MRLRALLGAVSVTLAACAPVQTPETMPIPQRCEAAAAQSLVGSHVGAVSFPADANVRIVCTTCPTTKDLRPDRLNIRYNQVTGVIERVDCG